RTLSNPYETPPSTWQDQDETDGEGSVRVERAAAALVGGNRHIDEHVAHNCSHELQIRGYTLSNKDTIQGIKYSDLIHANKKNQMGTFSTIFTHTHTNYLMLQTALHHLPLPTLRKFVVFRLQRLQRRNLEPMEIRGEGRATLRGTTGLLMQENKFCSLTLRNVDTLTR
ncbi:hypothetical protein L9F63_004677, partial [Diploptera punctata]